LALSSSANRKSRARFQFQKHFRKKKKSAICENFFFKGKYPISIRLSFLCLAFFQTSEAFLAAVHQHPSYMPGCQIFVGTTYQNLGKYANLLQNISNGNQNSQIAIKSTKINHSKGIPKYGQIGIFGNQIYYLATLQTGCVEKRC
jgi:hypothetical protein